ncbi:MAG: hypothetical protein KatS3mg076_1937 [Candidatus Binatia bacterium]|nr:MAG: hypothetical protein KatS3mg076_1937 [Candidatus Binatia bacterium]
MLKWEAFYKSVEATPRIKADVERQVRRVERRAQTFGDDLLFLRITLEKHPRKNSFTTGLTLELPRGELHAREEAPDPYLATKRAFDWLLEQFDGYKSQLRHERGYKRKRTPWTPPVPEQAQPEAREVLELLRPHFERLENYVRREIAFRIHVGDLGPGDLKVPDVLDDVVSTAVERFAERPEQVPLDRWLYQLARDRVERAVSEVSEKESSAVPLEEETPPDEEIPASPDEAFVELLEPVEDRFEDVLPDEGIGTPAESVGTEELTRLVHRTLGSLPRSTRDAFVLCVLEGFDPEEAAWVTRTDPGEIRREIEKAREILRDKLRQAGVLA